MEQSTCNDLKRFTDDIKAIVTESAAHEETTPLSASNLSCTAVYELEYSCPGDD